MLRALLFATLVLGSAGPFTQPAQGTLNIRVVLIDAEQKPTPVARHALLISDNPPSGAPKRVLTRLDGTVEVTLLPGVYTVESDRPIAFEGRAYQWTAMVEVAAGRAASLELTQDNVEVVDATTTAAAAGTPRENDPSFTLARWQDSTVAIWTATTRASGFVVDARGLVVTSQRAIGDATTAAVQFHPTLSVAANVVVVDAARDVAVLRIDPTAAGSAQPIAVECTPAAAAALAPDQDVLTVGVPLRGPKQLFTGPVVRVKPRVFADLRLSADSTGGPVFTAAGAVVGMTSAPLDPNERVDDVRIVGTADICAALGSADSRMTAVEAPAGTPLPVDPVREFPVSALDEAADKRVSGSIPYQMASSEFDIAFITPVLVHAAGRRWKQAGGGRTAGTPRAPEVGDERIRLLTEFGHWSWYFRDFPPVLLVRVTPKLVEGFWAKVARGAASTQGVALPPLKRLSAGFLRMRAFCGEEEVTPIHPFRLAHRFGERDVTHEGLYVFEASALGPHCSAVRLMVYSEKEADKPEARAVDPKVVQLFWQDFAAYRALQPQ